MPQDTPLTSEVSLVSDGKRAQIPDIPRPVLEALYKTLTGVTESLEVKRRFPSECKPNDIAQLLSLLEQWTLQYQRISSTEKIVVFSRSSDEYRGIVRSEYNSAGSFLNTAPANNGETETISIVFGFLSQNELLGRTNQCELTVELQGVTSRVLYEYDDEFPLGGKDWLSDRGGVTAKISVKYNDLLVAKGLVNVVDTWYRNLEEIEFEKMNFISKHVSRSSIYLRLNWIGWSTSFLPVIFGILFALGIENTSRHYSLITEYDLKTFTLIAAISGSTFAAFLFYAFNILNEDEDEYRVPLISINTPDEKRMKNFREMEKTRATKRGFWSKTVISGFLISVLASIATNLLW